MTDPFKPTYFLKFYEAHPADRQSIMELNRDMWTEEERAYRRLIACSVTSIGAIFLFTSLGGHIPLFRKYSRIFGVHRIAKLYTIATLGSIYAAYAPLRNLQLKTEKKLDEIHAHRIKEEGEFMEPTKPISYIYKHY